MPRAMKFNLFQLALIYCGFAVLVLIGVFHLYIIATNGGGGIGNWFWLVIGGVGAYFARPMKVMRAIHYSRGGSKS